MQSNLFLVLIFVACSMVVAAYPRFSTVIGDDQYYRPYRTPVEYEKRRPSTAQLRNCFLSPVQCLLPVEQRRFNSFHKRFQF